MFSKAMSLIFLLVLLTVVVASNKGDPCTPQGGEECFTAVCAEAPEGCTYEDGPPTINFKGVCCPKLCYAVDSEGKPCNGEDGNIREIEIQEEDSCVPNEPSNCPMASCAEAPEECTYVDGPLAVNALGQCCPKLCYSIDSEGKWCGEDTGNALNSSNSGEASAGNVTETQGLVASLLAVLHFFFGQ